MNPIFGKDPEEALAIARVLGAVQEPGEEEGRRLRAFLALSRLRSTAVTRLYRRGEAGPITAVSVALYYRVGAVVVEWNVDVSLPGQSVTDARAPDELTAFVSASLYVPEHSHHPSDAACRKCQNFWHAVNEIQVLQVLRDEGLPHYVAGKEAPAGTPRGGRTGAGPNVYGPLLTTNVEYVILRYFPEFVEEVRGMAEKAAWKAAKEVER